MYAHSDCDEGTAAVPEFDSAGVLSPAQRAALLEVMASPEYRSLEYATRARHDYDHADRREGDNDF